MQSWRATTAACLTAALCLLAACSEDHAPTTRAQASEAAQAGTADAVQLLGSAWEPVMESDAFIVGNCGDPGVGLALPERGLLEDATSPVLQGERHPERTPTETSSVRTAVAVYREDAGAKAAFAALGMNALEACLIDEVTAFVRVDHPDLSRAPDPTAESFDESVREVSAGDEATLLVAQFDDGILGGSDNAHDIALFVARSGAVVVTAIAVTSSQVTVPDGNADLARSLGVSALDHATAALD